MITQDEARARVTRAKKGRKARRAAQTSRARARATAAVCKLNKTMWAYSAASALIEVAKWKEAEADFLSMQSGEEIPPHVLELRQRAIHAAQEWAGMECPYPCPRKARVAAAELNNLLEQETSGEQL